MDIKIEKPLISTKNVEEEASCSTSSFPTSKNIPFPHAKPYPQQEAMIDAILSSLKQKYEYQYQQDSNIADNKRSGKKKEKANVMILESPTGTGKSLSVACASLAWLKFMEEQIDLKMRCDNESDSHEDKEEQKYVPLPQSTNKKEDVGLPWATGGQSSSEQREKEEQTKATLKCIEKAKQSRILLEDELSSIRNKINKMSFGTSQKKANNNDAVDTTRVRLYRGNLARSSVTAALVAERKQNRRNRKKMMGKTKISKKIKTNCCGTSMSNQNDFCVDDYNSDNDRRGKRTHDSDDDMFDSDGDNDTVERSEGSPLSPRDLINGHALDGSMASSNFNKYFHTVQRNKHSSKNRNFSNNNSDDLKTTGNVNPGSGVRKVIYSARTHSQLSQFVGEIRRVISSSPQDYRHIRVIALGGRKLLCGNQQVLKKAKGRESVITESCLDLQKGINDSDERKKRKKDNDQNKKTGCPLLSSKGAISALSLHMLAFPSDIEDLSSFNSNSTGSSTPACSYYASRESIPSAHILVVPYNILLSKETRMAYGISLEQNLVLIDEAHNIPESLRSQASQTSRLSLQICIFAHAQLKAYVQKYSNRLSSKNLFYLNQIKKCLDSFISYLKKKKAMSAANESNDNNDEHGKKMSTIMSIQELLFELKLDNINLFKVGRYLDRSNLAQKLLGFTNAYLENNNSDDKKGKVNGKEETTKKNGKDNGDDDDDINHNTHSPYSLSKHVSAMSVVKSFLTCLNSTSKEGKIVIEWPTTSFEEKAEEENDSNHSKSDQLCCFRYVLLNPASRFQNIIEEAYSVCLVGGTLRPFGHLATELLSGDEGFQDEYHDLYVSKALEADSLMKEREGEEKNSKKETNLNNINNPLPNVLNQQDSSTETTKRIGTDLTTFSCGHVVPPSNVYLTCLSKGPTNKTTLNFSHSKRYSRQVCDEIGRVLVNFCSIVNKGGLIVFLPSYSYQDYLFRQWKKRNPATSTTTTATTKTIWEQLVQKKHGAVYSEPKNARDVDYVLGQYAKANQQAAVSSATSPISLQSNSNARSCGALLFCVIGGKMSEGINFADEMARCVLLVGLPYPDITDAELKEKMDSLDANKNNQISGQSYYHNLCMRAVNQSIGRAIRHANDYATIVLCDERYSTNTKVWNSLPQWILKSSCRENLAFGVTLRNVRSFLKGHEASGK